MGLKEIAPWAGARWSILKSQLLLRDLHLHSKQHSGYCETVSSFYESEALQHNFSAGSCSLESRSPSLHPNSRTVAFSVTHLEAIVVSGGISSDSRAIKQNLLTPASTPTLRRPFLGGVWPVSHPGSDTEGSLIGVGE